MVGFEATRVHIVVRRRGVLATRGARSSGPQVDGKCHVSAQIAVLRGSRKRPAPRNADRVTAQPASLGSVSQITQSPRVQNYTFICS